MLRVRVAHHELHALKVTRDHVVYCSECGRKRKKKNKRGQDGTESYNELNTFEHSMRILSSESKNQDSHGRRLPSSVMQSNACTTQKNDDGGQWNEPSSIKKKGLHAVIKSGVLADGMIASLKTTARKLKRDQKKKEACLCPVHQHASRLEAIFIVSCIQTGCRKHRPIAVFPNLRCLRRRRSQ